MVPYLRLCYVDWLDVWRVTNWTGLTRNWVRPRLATMPAFA